MKKTSLGELIANAVSHGVGALLSIAALVVLLVISDTTAEVIASLVYGISLIILYFSSTLLHSFPEKMKRVFTVFQRLDHASIFILISGTYTPFLLVLLGTTEAYILLAVLWALTIFGIVMKSIWISKFKYVHLAIYLIMGWSIMLIYEQVFNQLGNIVLWVILGGVCYTVGVAFYVAKFKYQHFIWHLFVLAGSIFHFISIVLTYKGEI
jgi:hemolysin III